MNPDPQNRPEVLPVIMAGGSGTRLWPLSRAGYPKQFLVLGNDDARTSLFQQAAQRLMDLGEAGLTVLPPLVVGNEDHRFLVLDQLREIGLQPTAVLLEPTGRNTAPALTLAALQAQAEGHDPILVMTPADQTVTHPQAYRGALQAAVEAAADGTIVILGIRPDRPETGYGYIRSAASEDVQGHAGSAAVLQFVEKPDAPTAARYLAEGTYTWNSGMFVLRASAWLQALAEFRPDIASSTRAAWEARRSDQLFVRPDKALFGQVPSESIDYAVMERCPGTDRAIRMVPLDAGWNDLGAWDAVWQVAQRDDQGNATRGDALLRDSRNTLIHATSRLVGAVGVEDVVIVETPDAVLVADRSRSQDVKHIVASLSAQKRGEHTLHRKVHRPWGWYDSIDHGPRFQVKRIMVKPGASLSLQMHHHRAEHWIVVSGTAEVTNGDKVLILSENQSTYIPLGQTHRLANPGKVPLEIIEVQSGSYLGEDDIVRFEDTYGRSSTASAADAHMQGHYTAGEAVHIHMAEAGGLHHRLERLRIRMHADRLGQVAVALRITRDHLAHARQHMEGVPVIGLGQRGRDLRELQHQQAPTGLEHPGHLGQGALLVRHVAQAEGHRHPVEARIGIGQLLGIAQVRGQHHAIVHQAVSPHAQHRFIDVRVHHHAAGAHLGRKGPREITRAARDVQHTMAGPHIGHRHRVGLPHAVQAHGHHIVHDVVLRRHGIKDAAHA